MAQIHTRNRNDFHSLLPDIFDSVVFDKYCFTVKGVSYN